MILRGGTKLRMCLMMMILPHAHSCIVCSSVVDRSQSRALVLALASDWSARMTAACDWSSRTTAACGWSTRKQAACADWASVRELNAERNYSIRRSVVETKVATLISQQTSVKRRHRSLHGMFPIQQIENCKLILILPNL